MRFTQLYYGWTDPTWQPWTTGSNGEVPHGCDKRTEGQRDQTGMLPADQDDLVTRVRPENSFSVFSLLKINERMNNTSRIEWVGRVRNAYDCIKIIIGFMKTVSDIIRKFIYSLNLNHSIILQHKKRRLSFWEIGTWFRFFGYQFGLLCRREVSRIFETLGARGRFTHLWIAAPLPVDREPIIGHLSERQETLRTRRPISW
jgi:hypothetical protein